MSYILNALRKSEQERLTQREETLNSRILEQNIQTHQKIPGWLILLVLINLGVLGYFVVLHLAKPEESISNEQPFIQTPKSAVTKTPEAVAQVTEIIAKKADKSLSIDDIIKTKKSQKKKAELQAEKKPSLKPIEKEAVKMVKTIKEETPKALKNAIPLLSELPYQFRRNVPDVAINVFVYSETPKNRFIMIAMQKFVIGQEIVAGMVLNNIQADGIVVEFKGEVFKIKRN